MAVQSDKSAQALEAWRAHILWDDQAMPRGQCERKHLFWMDAANERP